MSTKPFPYGAPAGSKPPFDKVEKKWTNNVQAPSVHGIQLDQGPDNYNASKGPPPSAGKRNVISKLSESALAERRK